MGKGSQEMRFGVVAVKKGFVTPGQVVRALSLQVIEEMSKIIHRPIGEILLGQGIISNSQLGEVLMDMEKSKE
jgi:hypothetical protein